MTRDEMVMRAYQVIREMDYIPFDALPEPEELTEDELQGLLVVSEGLLSFLKRIQQAYNR